MKKTIWFLVVLMILSAADFAFAQARNKTRKKTTTSAPAKTAPPTVATASKPTESLPAPPTKKNERAATENTDSNEDASSAPQNAPKKANRAATPSSSNKTSTAEAAAPMPFFYEFTQPDFTISRVRIEHDSNGKGKITFEKKNWNEALTDPLQISPAALERIKNLYKELDFLNSSEDYQSKQYDYPHLGAMKLRVDENGKRREVAFNWTENKAAENLTKEYKRLTEQFVWMFDINLARENQPLESPKLMDRLEALVRRNEISDGEQMLPFLRGLADDERIPLIARNHVARVIKQIEKQKK